MRTVVKDLPQIGPTESAEFFSTVPAKCPKCGGRLKDYNAETAVTPPGVGIVPGSPLLAHLFVCNDCHGKLLAPVPQEP